MSEENTDDEVEFDLDDILEEEVVEEIQLEDIEMENEPDAQPVNDYDDSGEESQAHSKCTDLFENNRECEHKKLPSVASLLAQHRKNNQS